jgi:hypothetical protein
MNAKNLLLKDLQRHEVTVSLPGESEKRKLYLIEITAKTSKYDDFVQVYPEATPIHLKLAEKLFGRDEVNNIYGVFLDTALWVVFAFNREFADYDKKKQEIVFKPIDDLLLDSVSGKDTSVSDLKIKKGSFPKSLKPEGDTGPKRHPFRRDRSSFWPGDGGSSGVVRYSLTEEQES